MNQPLVLTFFFSFLLLACNNEIKKVPQEATKVRIPAFSGQAAYDLVQAQVDLGPRSPDSPGARAAIDWMKKQLKEAGWKVETQNFKTALYTGLQVEGTNIIARYKPEVIERVLLCAHWDTRMIADKDSTRIQEPIPGANDGGSGVAVLIQIAKTISAHPIPMGVDIVLFDLEDQGQEGAQDEYSWCLGSQYWASHLHETPYEVKYGILLDMVGAKDAVFPREGYSMNYAKDVVDKVWNVAKTINKSDLFINRNIGGITDDHRFIIQYADIPVINIIHYEEKTFMKQHHTHRDDMDIISAETLGSVGQVVLTTLYKESNGEL